MSYAKLPFRAIQTYGWVELGFDENYFVEMLMRAGFLVEYRHCEFNPRGSAYIARPYNEEINFGNDFLLPWEWHAGQIDRRWIVEGDSYIPLRIHDGELKVTLSNFSPGLLKYELNSDGLAVSGVLRLAETETIRLPARQKLRVRSNSQADEQSDPRNLGIAIKHVKFV